jgi:hypothetical protein
VRQEEKKVLTNWEDSLRANVVNIFSKLVSVHVDLSTEVRVSRRVRGYQCHRIIYTVRNVQVEGRSVESNAGMFYSISGFARLPGLVVESGKVPALTFSK